MGKDGKILNCSTHTRNPQLLKYYVEKYGTPRQSFEARYTKEHSLDDSLKRWKILMKRPSTSPFRTQRRTLTIYHILLGTERRTSISILRLCQKTLTTKNSTGINCITATYKSKNIHIL